VHPVSWYSQSGLPGRVDRTSERVSPAPSETLAKGRNFEVLKTVGFKLSKKMADAATRAR